MQCAVAGDLAYHLLKSSLRGSKVDAGDQDRVPVMHLKHSRGWAERNAARVHGQDLGGRVESIRPGACRGCGPRHLAALAPGP